MFLFASGFINIISFILAQFQSGLIKNNMKNLKLFLFALINFIAINTFSQLKVYTYPESAVGSCDGFAELTDSSKILIESVQWMNANTTLQTGTINISNLCGGNYSVSFTTINNSNITFTFTVYSYGTVVSPCQDPIPWMSLQIPLSAPNTCDAQLFMNVQSIAGNYSYSWTSPTYPNYYFSEQTAQTMGSIAGQLCAGTYCGTVIDPEGCPYTLCEIIDGAQPNGDTLIINGSSDCNMVLDSITTTVENCSINYNIIDTAYISSISFPGSSADTILVNWILLSGDSVSYSIPTYYYSSQSLSGSCNNFNLVLYCYLKSSNIKTLIANQNYFVGNVGVQEISNNKKKVFRIIDSMGLPSELIPNKFLIKCFSDGTTEKVILID